MNNTIVTKPRGRIFTKYVSWIAAVVSVLLIVHGAVEAWFLYQEKRTLLASIQTEQAEAATSKIATFVDQLNSQIGWTTQLSWSATTFEQRHFDALRLMRQAPAITEFVQTDENGREQLKVSRIDLDVLRSQRDLTDTSAYAGAIAHQIYYGPIYFRRDSEPYMTMALTGPRSQSSVSIAEINLKFIGEVVSQIGAVLSSDAYVVDSEGKLIAHPNISLVLRNTDLSASKQVAEARANSTLGSGIVVARDINGQDVLSAYSRVKSTDWLVFVDVPLQQAYAPLYSSLLRTAVILFVGLCLALVCGILLARRLVIPIKILQDGAQKIGSGNFGHKVEVRTGDEIEELADQFNKMSSDLRQSLERTERMGRLRRFLSPQLADVIESSGGDALLESHRREITAVFCDLRGFTAFAESAAPEEVMRVLGEYHAGLGALIYKYEGTLERFVGDGLLVLFNDPLPCPDPSERAVKMAIEMRTCIADLTTKWRRLGHQLGFGMGIAHGFATLGRIGFEGRFDYSAIGTVVNLAARLCNDAADGQILIEGKVLGAVEPFCEVGFIGNLILKGLRHPVPAYNVFGLREAAEN